MSKLRLMTFNIANALETEDDGENAWAFRAPLNVRTIKRDARDLETFQNMLAEYQYILVPPPMALTSMTTMPSPFCQSG